MTLIRFGWCLVLVSIAAGCGGNNPDRSTASTPASSPPQWTVKVEPLDPPAGATSMGPQLTTSSRGVLVSWLEQADTDFA